MTKLSNGVSSGIAAFGSTKAPRETSKLEGVEGEEGVVVRTTFAKWVGTAMLGGEPITSYVYGVDNNRRIAREEPTFVYSDLQLSTCHQRRAGEGRGVR